MAEAWGTWGVGAGCVEGGISAGKGNTEICACSDVDHMREKRAERVGKHKESSQSPFLADGVGSAWAVQWDLSTRKQTDRIFKGRI